MNNLELNKIYCESNLDTMSRMPDNFVDLVVTSPPYDGLRDYNGYSFPFEEIAKELYRVTKDGGVVVWNVNDSTINGSESLTSFKQAIYFVEECNFKLHDTMIYSKKNYMPLNDKRYENAFEYMFVFVKGKINTFNPLKDNKKTENKKDKKWHRYSDGSYRINKSKSTSNEKVRSNIWEYVIGSSVSSDKLAFKHPAIFPEKLVADHIYSWSNEGCLIYDPFMGSGTTAKMAHIYKRNWIGSELSQEYVDLANKRLQPYLAQQRLF